MEDNREKLGKFLREVKDTVELCGKGNMEACMIRQVTTSPLDDVRIAAVDGGLSRHEYHGMDIILTRAVAAVFDYRNGRLDRTDYYPH